jgi:hypothetical protein
LTLVRSKQTMPMSAAQTRDAARRRSMRAWSLALLLIAAPVSGAPPRAKPPLTPDRIAPAVPGPLATQAICTVGTSGPAVYVVDYLQPPDDAYFLRAQTTSCGTCSIKPGVWVSAVHLKLEYRVPCSQPVEVAVVSTLGDTACAPPDPPRIARGPVTALLTAPSPGTFDFTVPLEGPVALLKDTYLRVTFTADGAGCTAPGTRPRLVTTSGCLDCFAWNYFPADTSDLCQLLFPGTPILYANVDSCVAPSLAGVGDRGASTTALRAAPMPARSSVELRFTLAAAARVRLTVCDVAGRHVRELLDGPLAAGDQRVAWDARADDGTRVRAGTYFAVLRQGERTVTHTLVLLGADR